MSLALLSVTSVAVLADQTAKPRPSPIRLDSTTKFELTNSRVLWVDYRGRRALKLAPPAGHERDTDQELVATIVGSEFKDGVIDVDVSGARRQGYSTAEDVSGFKGIVGISFRIRGDSAERFYIRPENSRVNNQLFRNRSTQYESSPDYPWQRLRQENPGVYESYVDVESGGWTHLRIEVLGSKARLFVNGSRDPCLVVNDLKHGASHGAIALWARISSEAYFSNLRVQSTVREPKGSAGKRLSADSARGELPAFSEVVNGRVERVTYRGVKAIKLIPAPETAGKDEDMLALVEGPEFKDGTIQLQVAGAPRPGTPADSRGFIGLSFRTGPHAEWSEIFYLRPTNGRSDDQLRRNHSVQYVSHPEFPWNRLRQESPGVYESYADMEAGAWTAMKIVVAGTTARLYLNGAPEPVLVVNDLKGGDRAGRIAFWAHVETDAYFGPVSVTGG
jgi:hypothetical protein